MCFWSIDRGEVSDRPHVTITYEPRTTKPIASKVAPIGNVGDAPTFTVAMNDEDADQRLSAYQIEVRRVSDKVVTWSPDKRTATPAERDALQSDLRAPASKWGIGTRRSGGAASGTARPAPQDSGLDRLGQQLHGHRWRPDRWGPPQAIGSVPSMAGVHFAVPWTHPQGKGIASLRIQLRPSTPPGDPDWDGVDNAWDTGAVYPEDGGATRH